MKKYKFLILFILSNIIFLNSCVEVYDKNFTPNTEIIIIDGQLTNEPNNKPVNIKTSVPSGLSGSSFLDVNNAEVSIEINGKEIQKLEEKEVGYYYFPESFKGVIGSTYKLKISLPNGEKFESNTEVLNDVPSIKKVYHEFDINGIVDTQGNKSSAFNIYCDTEDPANEQNNYLWNYTLYENQPTCKTCTGGRFFVNPLPEGVCIEDALLKRYNNIFDYDCKTLCWEILRSDDQTINNDEFYNGKTLKAQLVGKIPLYQYSSALVDVEQYSISKEAFDFIRLSQKLGKETGGLADTPPAALKGNIKSMTDPNKNISGFFIVSGVKRSLYWLDKVEAVNQKAITIGLLGGRSIKNEPQGPDTTRPPLAPCINSRNRTNQRPIGWRN